MKSNRDVVVSNRHPILKNKFFPQTKDPLEPLRTPFRVADSQSKVTNNSKNKRRFHPEHDTLEQAGEQRSEKNRSQGSSSWSIRANPWINPTAND